MSDIVRYEKRCCFIGSVYLVLDGSWKLLEVSSFEGIRHQLRDAGCCHGISWHDVHLSDPGVTSRGESRTKHGVFPTCEFQESVRLLPYCLDDLAQSLPVKRTSGKTR